MVHQGRIQEITLPGKSNSLGEQIEATGMAVSSGFIDMHSHSDLAALQDKEHLAKTTQGVTLEVVGQDGLSYAPVNPETKAELAQQLAGWNGKPELSKLDFSSIGEYLDKIDQGSALNVAMLLPHGTLRMLVMGGAARYATENELNEMKTITEISMKEGAVGMSAGLTYTPAIYAHDDELVELCKTVAHHGGYYAPHHRNYGLGFLDAVDECLDISKKSDCPLHLTHCHLSAPKFWGRANLLLDKLTQAKINDIDVSLDSYPYLAGMTYLHAFLPSWINEGGLKKAKDRIENSDARAKLIHELKVVGTDGNQGAPVNWSAVIIAHVNRPRNNNSIGMNLEQYAKNVNKDVAEAYLDLIVDEDFEASCVIFAGNEENVRAIMQHEKHMIGSDGILFGKRPHPRAWGCFTRILGVYARDEKVISLEGAVARMTGRPATRIGLKDRGFVKPGQIADLVLFDPNTVIDKATYEKPREQSEGIEHVFVAGEYVIKNRKRTDLVVGRSVRNSKYWSKA
ncbi:MAG: N-acyl-D-amino-acid deacylase family protein [Candidatus Nanopelagicales bacterium]